jgi:hypothetical protein
MEFFFGILKVTEERSRIRRWIRIQRYGSAESDPHQKVTDPQHWNKSSFSMFSTALSALQSRILSPQRYDYGTTLQCVGL